MTDTQPTFRKETIMLKKILVAALTLGGVAALGSFIVNRYKQG